ncbi:MAG: S1C family serine protease [Rudaea sp.]
MEFESLQGFSDEVRRVVERAGRSIVRVGDGERSAGTGIVWSRDGVILTANHVVERARSLHVRVSDTSYDVVSVARDPATDLALLWTEASGLERAEIGDSRELQVGNLVLALGHPWGDRLTVTAGVVSALGPVRAGGRWHERFRDGLVQTDLRLYPGFSGGPLVDARGRVVGIDTSVVGGDLGVAIPIETVKRVAVELERRGSAKQSLAAAAVQTFH